MKNFRVLSTLLSAIVLSASSLAQAQSTKPPAESARMSAFMDRDTFLAMHRWDEMTGLWVVKSDMELPKGIKPRSEVMAMMDVFMSKHQWDNANATWMPLTEARDMSKLTREQVRMETTRFLMMYRFDESRSEWVSKMR